MSIANKGKAYPLCGDPTDFLLRSSIKASKLTRIPNGLHVGIEKVNKSTRLFILRVLSHDEL